MELSIELELRKLGLKEKEVKVYLAGLELGPSSVQKIARVAKITRPTAYEIIKHLEGKGLFLETIEKKKKYFVAQSPKRILGILRTQKREIAEKEREFVRIISALESKYSKEKGEFKTYKEKEGLAALEEIFSFTSTPEIFLINPKSTPFGESKTKKIIQEIKKRLGKIKIKEVNLKLNGGLIIFDKIIYFPSRKSEGILIENETIINLLKSIFETM